MSIPLPGAQPASNVEENYWISYHKSPGPRIATEQTAKSWFGGAVFGIAVVVDPPVKNPIIRVIIVINNDDHFADTVIRDYVPTVGKLALTSQSRRTTTWNTATADSPFTVVFEMKTDINGVASVELKTWPLLTLQATFRTVYHRAYSSRAIFTMLQCELPICMNPSLLHEFEILDRFSTVSHSIRIQATTFTRRGLPQLPPEALRSIALKLAEGYTKGWRPNLLAMGLVQRSWAHILDTFFEAHPTNDVWCDQPSLISVSRSLVYRSERALNMSQFHFHVYSGVTKRSRSPQKSVEFTEAMLTILTLAKRLRHLTVPMDVLRRGEFVRALSYKRELEILSVGTSMNDKKHFLNAYHSPVNVDTLLTLMGYWPRLRTLNMAVSTASSLLISEDENFASGKYLNHRPASPNNRALKLMTLELSHVQISPTQFSSFFPSSSPPLTKLTLRSITGLANQDLYDVLLPLVPSLEHLIIAKCTLDKTSREDHALDRLIPYFTSLKTLLISGAVFTERVIAGKVSQTYGDASLTMHMESYGYPAALISKLAASIEAGAWKRIVLEIFTYESPSAHSWLHIEKAREVAARKGVTFIFDVDYIQGVWF